MDAVPNVVFTPEVPDNVREVFKWASDLAPLGKRWVDKFGSVNVTTAVPAPADGVSGRTQTTTRKVELYLDQIAASETAPDVLHGGVSLPLDPVFPDALHHVVLHEWMHVLDTRKGPYDDAIMGAGLGPLMAALAGPTAPSYPPELGYLSVYAINGGDAEAFAEAGAVWFASLGKTQNAVADWYAKMAKWAVGHPMRVSKWDYSASALWTPELADKILRDAGIPEPKE